MKYVDEFCDEKICHNLTKKIAQVSNGQQITFMEVCGTHTMAIFRYGIKSILPTNIKLLSGPGCPVCVTPNSDIDKMIAYARQEGVIVVTFGDMMKVPGSTSSLSKERALGGDIRVVYSVSEAIRIAKGEPTKKVVFIGIGFETTAPSVGVSILEAEERKLSNYFVFCVHKTIPLAIKAILDSGELKLDGLILPGHVSTIIGARAYEFIPRDYGVPCVVAGFEAVDIFQAILMLTTQVRDSTPQIATQYTRSVKSNGNPKAIAIMDQVFEPTDSEWRGIGVIPNSGLKISPKYSKVDAEKNIDVEVEPSSESPDCICGEILRGVKTPHNCKLFGKACLPESPIGPCMVSSEGTCAAYYKYMI